MKKKTAIISGILAVFVALGIGMYAKNVSQAAPTLSHEEVKSLVTAQYPGTITELELDRENDQLYYEIEIENDEMEYELKVDANSGEILRLKEKLVRNDDSKSKQVKLEEKAVAVKEESDDDDDDDNNQTVTVQNSSPQTKVESKEVKQQSTEKKAEPKKQSTKAQSTSQKTAEKKQEQVKQQKTAEKKQEPKTEKKKKSEGKETIIDRNRAVQIALAKFPGKVEEVELDDDDGRLIYEIEIENGDKEAEFDIDAKTGKILKFEIDD